jgi:hypothetical protein
MRVLVACEFSGVVRDAFIRHGHDAVSCDLLPTESDGPHIEGDVLDILDDGWDLMVAHPPCTYLTNAGVRYLHDHVTSRRGNRASVYGEDRWEAMRESAAFFNALRSAPVPRVAVENPIPHKYARELIGRYDQLIQPWMFGHGETKATCLWLRGLPPLMATLVVEGREAKVHRMSPGPDRGKKRSVTYRGIADALARQWGGFND